MVRNLLRWPLGVVVGFLALIGIGASATFYLREPANLGKGFVHVRAGRVALHREWMIRAFAIALAVATLRLIFIPSLFVVVDPTDVRILTLSLAAWSAALVVHSSLAEAWIHLTRKRGVPEAGGARAYHEPTPKNR